MRRLTRAQSAEVRRLRLSRGGVLKAEDVVAYAVDESTALHSFFEWDQDAAANQYRLWQARQVISLYVDVIVEGQKPVRAMVSLSSDRAAGGGYRRVRDVLDDAELRAVMLDDALAELRLHRDKYQTLKELAEVWSAAEKVEEQTNRVRRRKAA